MPTNDPKRRVAQQRRLVAKLKPHIAGCDPSVQGAALAELLAIFLAGHHPELRGEILRMHIEAVRGLIAPCEAEIFSTRPRPKEWPTTQ